MIRLKYHLILAAAASAIVTSPSLAAVVPSPLAQVVDGDGDPASALAAAAGVDTRTASGDFLWSTTSFVIATPSPAPSIDVSIAVHSSDAVTPTLPGDAIEREPPLVAIVVPTAAPAPIAAAIPIGVATEAPSTTASSWPIAMLAATLALATGAAAYAANRAGGVAPILERVRTTLSRAPRVTAPRRRSSRGSPA